MKKRLLIVNNNMKIGGVQKSLLNLLWAVCDEYDVTLCLFRPVGALMQELPPCVRVVSCNSAVRFLGISQAECAGWPERLRRGALAALCRLLGRPFVLRLMLIGQPVLAERYDAAIAFLHNGNVRHFYGGVQEFVLRRVRAGHKIAFLHCDFLHCGADHPANRRLYRSFDRIAACSEGCRSAFLQALPQLRNRCAVVPNFHRFEQICRLADLDPICYPDGEVSVLMVARLAHEKRVDRAIRAVAAARAADCPVHLYLVGAGAMEQELRALAAQLLPEDAITFCGEQSNPYQYMKHADLLLITSEHEAAPLIIDEARCLALPVLSTATSSAQEMVADRGCGWVCPNSQEGLTVALERLCRNPDLLQRCRASLENAACGNAATLAAFQSLLDDEG